MRDTNNRTWKNQLREHLLLFSDFLRFSNPLSKFLCPSAPVTFATLLICVIAPLPETKCRRLYFLHTLLVMSLHTTIVCWYRHTRATRFMHPQPVHTNTQCPKPSIDGYIFLHTLLVMSLHTTIVCWTSDIRARVDTVSRFGNLTDQRSWYAFGTTDYVGLSNSQLNCSYTLPKQYERALNSFAYLAFL